MKGFKEFYANVVTINEKEIRFKYHILSIYISESRVYIVVYAMENERIKNIPKEDLNNVFCYDYDGNLIWQIKPPKFKELSEQYIIAGVKIIDNKLYAFDWFSRRFEVNQENGELIGFIISK